MRCIAMGQDDHTLGQAAQISSVSRASTASASSSAFRLWTRVQILSSMIWRNFTGAASMGPP